MAQRWSFIWLQRSTRGTSPTSVWEVNLEGTRNLLEAAAAASVERFVHGSTIGVYGAAEGQIDETTPMRPDNLYGLSKAEARKTRPDLGLQDTRDGDPDAEVYGPGDRRL